MKKIETRLLLILIALALALVWASYLLYRQRVERPVTYDVLFPANIQQSLAGITNDELEQGRKLSLSRCVSCHKYPPPEILPREFWREVFKKVGVHLGIGNTLPRLHEENVGLVENMKLYGKLPGRPLTAPRDFRTIVRYYYATAPAQPAPLPTRELSTKLTRFRVGGLLRQSPGQARDVTLVKIDEKRRRAFVGSLTSEAGDGQPVHAARLEIVDARLKTVETMRMPSPPVSVHVRGEELHVATLGGPGFGEGGVDLIGPAPGRKVRPLVRKPYRVAWASVADLTGDGREDLVVCGFGYNWGEFAWHENLGDRFVEHLFFQEPGSIRSEVRDFNGDGRPDIMLLTAQAREDLMILLNQGGGKFKKSEVYQRHPAFGHANFDLADFNGDGRLDLVVANGDNGDYPAPPLKNFHGVRIYLNRGDLKYEESYFFPLHGAYKALARDFDQDGDIDLAIIALYPDRSRPLVETFVYLENQSAGARRSGVGRPGGAPGESQFVFRAFVLPELSEAAPGVMDAGDIDGDGDIDLIIGTLPQLSDPSRSEGERTKAGRKGAPPPAVILLLNTLR